MIFYRINPPRHLRFSSTVFSLKTCNFLPIKSPDQIKRRSKDQRTADDTISLIEFANGTIHLLRLIKPFRFIQPLNAKLSFSVKHHSRSLSKKNSFAFPRSIFSRFQRRVSPFFSFLARYFESKQSTLLIKVLNSSAEIAPTVNDVAEITYDRNLLATVIYSARGDVYKRG